MKPGDVVMIEGQKTVLVRAGSWEVNPPVGGQRWWYANQIDVIPTPKPSPKAKRKRT
jgi:hypothetical protein